MGHPLLKKAILLLKMANVPFDLLIAVCIKIHFLLERALRALASSSGGAACPGGQGVGVKGSTPWVGR